MSQDELVNYLSKHPLKTAYFYSSLLKEIAFALIIAIIIAIGIERSAKEQQVEEVKDAVEKIQEDVFKATLKRNIPGSIVDKVYSSIFQKQFVRENSRISIHLRDFPPECPDRDGHIIYEILHNYDIRNICGHAIDYPLRLYGPSPVRKELREYLPKMEIVVEAVSLTIKEIDEGTESIENQGFEERFQKTIPMAENSTISVTTKICFAKMAEDSEVWVSMVSTLGTEIAVQNSTQHALSWDIDQLFFGQLHPRNPDLREAPYHSKSGAFGTSDVMLPYHGFVLSWRPTEQVLKSALAVIEPVNDERPVTEMIPDETSTISENKSKNTTQPPPQK